MSGTPAVVGFDGRRFVTSIGVLALVFAGIYWINQYAVRTDLEPRRQELLAVRENLMKGDE